ncbi:hypothetical protein [Smaragdicoccus niigatensis]|uniref:hypothetical protein n=1 Tax=Smaragdicoccus niigatensis TaxID=359359 RepID=UPI00146BD13B|nr:hypothetical protein [Smaragdicoccus niigatensis]
MCSPIPCRTCGKTTWTGCGQHVDAVKASVASDQWCEGHAEASPGIFSRIFGR